MSEREREAQSQTGPYPLALSTPPPLARSRGGSATLRAIKNQAAWSVSGLLNPYISSLKRCRLKAVLAGSATKERRKQHTNGSSVFLLPPGANFTCTFVTLTNKITITVVIQICCSSDGQLI